MTNHKDNNNRTHKNLYYLNELSDYKIASDDPDVRGWKVKDQDNRVIGEVDNLLVNKTTERVVYLDVEVDSSIIEADHDPYGQPANGDVHEFINKEGENHIIIPVGLVSLNHDDKFVYTDRINHRTFAETKRMEKGSTVNREYEVVVLDSYDREYSNDSSTISDSTTSTYNDRRDTDSTFDRDNNRRDSGLDRDNDRSSSDFDQETYRRDSGLDRDNDRSSSDFDRETNRRDSGLDRDNDRSSSDFNRERNRRDPNFDSDRDRRDLERDRDYQNRDRNRDRAHDDDSFYERREFNRTNYKRRT